MTQSSGQNVIWLTQDAYNKLQEELNNLRGPVRSEIISNYVYPAITRFTDPRFFYFRPDLRVKVYKTLGVYTQFEYNGAVATNQTGFRFGVELNTTF